VNKQQKEIDRLIGEAEAMRVEFQKHEEEYYSEFLQVETLISDINEIIKKHKEIEYLIGGNLHDQIQGWRTLREKYEAIKRKKDRKELFPEEEEKEKEWADEDWEKDMWEHD
jgi:hypothetical protein